MDFEGMSGWRPEPGGREPAPGPLRLVQLFVNTVDREDGPELLGDPAGLRAWLAAHDLGDHAVTATDHARAIALREALRALAAAHGGAPADESAAETVNAALERARLRPLLDGETIRLEPQAAGIDGALGHV